MRRLALILATAVVASGCIVGDDNHRTLPPSGVGSAIVYWDFLRNTQGGTVLYDDATLTHTGTGACAQSAVEVVTIDAAGLPQFVVDCVYQGVQGATLDGLPAGSPSARIRGWRGNYAVYETTVALHVIAGAETDQGIVDLDAVRAPMDLFAYLALGPAQAPTDYRSCAEAGWPNVSYEVRDSYGTRVDANVVGCSDPLPTTVFAGDLDLDNYTVRMQGIATQGPSSGQVVLDSCTVPFDHFAAQIGDAGFAPTLVTPPPSCP
ncbi:MULTISPECIES: hypothetical protein [Anaeromyxobacter]|uniref:hypothetical protein n=1 Tax=Anaeromyxobacter TaxID=161492 RepID=UPI001F565DA4|nr:MULTISPECIES: hypothetical protein [unclassified Anaeromyxobacter]